MNSSRVLWLLKVLRRAYQISTPQPHGSAPSERRQNNLTGDNWQSSEFQPPHVRFVDGCTYWKLSDVWLKPGWYMLEVEHSLDSIGCVLTTTFPNHLPNYLQLTSKSVCKRIVRLSTSVRRCDVTINDRNCTIRSFRVIALSKAFAARRMQNRLSNRGRAAVVNTVDEQTLYMQYQALMHEFMQPRPYMPIELDSTIDESSSHQSVAKARDARLIVHAAQMAGVYALDESVTKAVSFARGRGWKVDIVYASGIANDLDAGALTENTYHLAAIPGTRFSLHAFHQLMNAVTDRSILVYADHDFIDTQGNRISPALKPAWNPELLLNTNYIQQPWMVRGSWLRQLEQIDFKPTANFESVLLAAALGVKNNSEVNLISALDDNQVVRVPSVLASLKVHDEPIDEAIAVKASHWQCKVRHALSLANAQATVTNGVSADLSRVLWKVPENQPSVDIIVPTRDQVSVLKACIDSILDKTGYKHYRTIIVDNDSQQPETEHYFDSIRDNARFRILQYPGAFNYAAMNNFAVSKSSADILILLNNDTEVISPHWIEELVSQAIRPEVGCVGAKLHYSNGRIQHGGVIVGINDVAGHAHRYSRGDAQGYCDRLIASQNFSAVTAACLAVRRVTYQKVGGLDEHHLQVAWNDVDFCLKVKELGLRNVWTPHAQLFHHEGLSRGADNTRAKVKRVNRERAIMKERWDIVNFKDPAYHPSLTRSSENFNL
ncbi:glycosyltransferase family 2 protein [bacterium]|nr:glycosyltransferase family 2 protein [bacterium]